MALLSLRVVAFVAPVLVLVETGVGVDELHVFCLLSGSVFRRPGEKRRTIPQGAKIHASVQERMNRAASDCRPSNLPSNPTFF